MDSERSFEQKVMKERPLEERVESIYQRACAQHEELTKIPPEALRSTITQMLTEVDMFECVARENRASFEVSPEVAHEIGAIWVFSGPGTYDQPVKDDAYKKYPWARNMDRLRLDYAARIARNVTAAITGTKITASPDTISEAKRATKEAIRESGPSVFYNGTMVENESVRTALEQENGIMTVEKVFITPHPVRNTLEQVRDFVLPGEALSNGKTVAIVSHAPHLSRVLRMLNRFKPLPEDSTVLLFPMPTPDDGKEEYAATEITAIMYYAYVSGEGATPEPYPYKLYQSQPHSSH